MKVYLVENVGESPGRIQAIFRHEDDAELFAESLCDVHEVVPRTLFEGQPDNRGYNE